MNSPHSPESGVSPALRSIHTNTFLEILNQLGISLLVSTYQAGKLIVIRADAGAVNTHFRVFQKPMGLAVDGDRLAIGTAAAIWELSNNTEAAKRVPPEGKHDACFLPRNIHITGDIDIHEMAWSGPDLWFINTRFSCLCTWDQNHSFVPQWRPPFISAYDLRDRCHLNGLGLRDGRPKYVTALGETDGPGGWRTNKADGGILMDIDSNEIILRGLSMPHSPRWYQNRLWVLESGKGSLSYLDPISQSLISVAQLPGFTRGLDFYGNWAFIGLSQIRESAVFSGLPLTQTLSERICGVWIVDIHQGETIAFLKFEEAIQEIFSVCVLPGMRFPEVIEWDENLLSSSYVLPQAALSNAVHPSQDWEFAETYFVQGNSLYQAGNLEAALTAFQKCLQLQPTYLPARFNLGVTLGNLERYDEAIIELQQVIANEVGHAEALNSLGFVYSQQRQPELAQHYYEKAIQIQPDFAKAHHNLGMTLLQVGDFKRGWPESEWRWQTPEFTPFQAPQPCWTGEDIKDKVLLIHTEQGAGDAIQFIRYLPLAAERCHKLILVCPTNLFPLFETVPGVAEIRTAGTISLRAFDTYCALMSLPCIFQTTLDTIPNQIPYLQVPVRSELTRFLQSQKQEKHLRIGFVWAGSSTHANDHHRSCPLTHFLPLLALANCQFYSLQVGDSAPDLQPLSPALKVVDLAPYLKDYGDTAVALDFLDLVITVDTSVAHLAGALGKKVWTLLCYNPDWRWLLDREDSPWYPSMRLFRQSRPQDWPTVIQQVMDALLEEGLRSSLTESYLQEAKDRPG